MSKEKTKTAAPTEAPKPLQAIIDETLDAILSAPADGAVTGAVAAGIGSLALGNAFASDADVKAVLATAVKRGRGRPAGTKNKPKPEGWVKPVKAVKAPKEVEVPKEETAPVAHVKHTTVRTPSVVVIPATDDVVESEPEEVEA